ncbi:peroxiredoxin [Flavobacterium jejuense]|uniref:thioredoxin-dependent peroxiredoxin n=1 Tax=Flavobacterium jejuense TaxID=1544455 RepID=A0ABX0ISX8_9FLAO|nr:peroxiredoxin [Flavobacterium jejuense]NHN26215.1 peroxiredoxin [Flavobacterium jejuense]
MGLKVGDKVPDFTAKDQHGVFFKWSEYLGKPTVIYFYPKDDTPGCTAQACSFRDEYQDFKDLGAEVIGVSGDSEKSHVKFAQKYNLPFILLSDKDKSLRKLFDVPTNLLGLIPGRVTYVIDSKGVVQLVFNSMSAKNHISVAKAKIKEL